MTIDITRMRRQAFARHLGEVMKNEREAQGMSQRDAAMLIGVECSTLCRWERGIAVVTALQTLQWARAMGCDVTELLEHAEMSLEN